MIESIREYIPLNDCLIDFDEDPLRFEHIFPGSITFVDTQSGNRNFVHGYMTQADISRMGSNCDLVPEPYREITKDVSLCTFKNERWCKFNVGQINEQKFKDANS